MLMPKLRLCLVLLILIPNLSCKTNNRSTRPESELANVDPTNPPNNNNVSENEFVVLKSKFPKKITQALVTRYADEMERLEKTRSDSCLKSEAFIGRLVTRLIAGSRLQTIVSQTPPLVIGVACTYKGFKHPQTKSGVLWIYPDILSGFTSEDQVAALLAHEISHYTRSHEEDIENTLDSWMPFRENAVNRSKWEQEKEADRLSVLMLSNAGFDPFAAIEAPVIMDKVLAASPEWKQGQLNFPLDSAENRTMKIEIVLRQNKLKRSTQSVGELPSIKDELRLRR